MLQKGTYFYDAEGNQLGSDEDLLPIPLYKGMKITIHGHHPEAFEVVDWEYRHGQPDEEAGLKIILRAVSSGGTGRMY